MIGAQLTELAGSLFVCPVGELEQRQAALDELTAACVEAMVRSTCQVMAGNTPGPAASTVFVAGVGPARDDAGRAGLCGVALPVVLILEVPVDEVVEDVDAVVEAGEVGMTDDPLATDAEYIEDAE